MTKPSSNSSDCRAKDPSKCRYHKPASFMESVAANMNTAGDTKLSLSNGVLVEKGRFQTSDFARSFNKREGVNSHYEGSWDDLEKLVTENKDDFEPGTGSVDNDVILVNVPAEGFYTSIVEVDDSNRHLVEEREHVRQEGEKPVSMKIIPGVKKPAEYVQIVCYRADVLAKDNDRSNNAEWEIIAINAQKDKVTPMHPTTMIRNNNHDEGGTYREYTQKEWDDAYSYWENHAYIEQK